MKKILVIAVHPDDETLGCGGTLLKHQMNGDEIHWLICTQTDPSAEFFSIRLQEIEKAASLYRFKSVHRLGLRTMNIDQYSMSDLIMQISQVIKEIQPEILYLPFAHDVHTDHRIIFEAAYSCTKSFRYPFIKKVLMMETLSETEFAPPMSQNGFTPNVFVDITPFIEKKIEILNIFKSEISYHPFPRSDQTVKALAMLRGATASCEYAESFVLLKEII